MVLPRFVLLVLLSGLLAACSSSASSISVEDLTGSDLTSADSGGSPEEVSVDPTPDAASQPLFAVWYDGFSLPDDQPTVYLEANKINGPNLVTFFVKAKNLGSLAGAAFYLSYDTEFLRFDNGISHLNLGDSGPYFTANAVKELAAGHIAFGAARFCKAKIPWGSTDQCGGIEVGEATTVAALTFALVGEGQGSLRFPEANTLLLRPDRSSVDAVWIGGSFIVEEQGVAP